jgi:hypothetical protein
VLDAAPESLRVLSSGIAYQTEGQTSNLKEMIMRQQLRAEKRCRAEVAILVAMGLVVMFAAGCDSHVDIKGPRLTLPTVPTAPTVASGPTVSESRPIAGVSGVTLQAVGHAQIVLGGTESLTITAPESVMELLTSEVVAGRLVLDRNSASYQGQASDIQYDVSLRRLDALILDGVGRLSAQGVDTGRFTVRVNGVGEIEASGRADRQEVRVEGVGGYVAPRLESRVTNVNLSAGNAVVWATERLEGWVGVGSTVEYRGDPVVSIQGGGSVRRLGFKP